MFRRWWALGFWAIAVSAGLALGGGLFEHLQPVDGLSSDAESARAERAVQQAAPEGPTIFAVVHVADLYDPVLVASVTAAVEAIDDIAGVEESTSLYTSPGGAIGADNTSTLVRVELAANLADERLLLVEDQVRAQLHTIAARSVLVGGDHLAERAFGEQALRDLAVGESIAFAVLILMLIVAFDGFLGASLPLLVAAASVSVTLLVLRALAEVTAISEYSLNIVTLLGLGLAVDYALLIIGRYREELAHAESRDVALRIAMTRAGRAVAISGLAVAGALAGLGIFAEPLLASMAVGGATVVVVTTVLSLTAVPALLSVAGRHVVPAGSATWVRRLRRRWKRSERDPLLVRLTSVAQRRPMMVAVLATLGMVGLASPVIAANLANSDVRALPRSVEERRAFDAYQELFSPAGTTQVTVVATAASSDPMLRDYLNQLNTTVGVRRVALRNGVPDDITIVDLQTAGLPAGPQSRDVVRAVREAGAPFPVLVGGAAAEVVDYQDSVRSRLTMAILVVVMVMVVLLVVLTKSVVIALKAVLLNALTFAATMGVLVAVFQWGWGSAVLRFDSWSAIDLTTPLLLFVFSFGVSMDYEVFLLSRITEEHDRGATDAAAVRMGIARSGPVVTAAAAAIVVVFLGFAAGGLVAVKEIGIGMMVAVVLDVTVVRGLLLPATMALLGRWNWWRPTRPKRLVARRAGMVNPSPPRTSGAIDQRTVDRW